MNALIAEALPNIGYSILASMIWDISKICFGKNIKKIKKISKESINKIIEENLKEKYESLLNSSSFYMFIENPCFKDVIENYLIYKITGNYELDSIKISDPINETQVIDHLTNSFFDKFYNEEAIIKLSKSFVRNFFKDFFKLFSNFFLSILNSDDIPEVFLINHRLDLLQDNLFYKLDKIHDLLSKTMRCEYVSYEEKYDDVIKEYHSILRTNNSKAHVYLLDTLEFSEFYVPPFLKINDKESRHFFETLRLEFDSFHRDELIAEDAFDDWRYIFDNNSIVYVAGGAGYGKSLFLKKIINDYFKLNMLNSGDYLVIYGDLKAFYKEGEQPISIIKFLQESMVKETLMSESLFPDKMIEQYIKLGRCLILFDALDEVEKGKREDLHKKIIGYFKNQNPNNKICITSRNRGFIPEKNVEVFDILPLNRIQIEKYVNNIISLGRFSPNDKETFLQQSKVLVDKGFLNSFLVLSLLINIYKAERELPENKMELYQKCFEYIANRREREKTKPKYNWDLISCMMKDNTFMELSEMCFPNNTDIGKDEIVAMLCKIYRSKYASDAETERAALDFLAFCSDRTELFVPAAGEDRFKFFHRSFFEYFYSQYIFLRKHDVSDVYNSLSQFDVDSEVFELTFAMMKQKDENRYQELISYIFSIINDNNKNISIRLTAFNILTLAMQVIDDKVYREKYINFLIDYSDQLVINIDNLSNQRIIIAVIQSKIGFIKKINKRYEKYAKLKIINCLLELNKNTFNIARYVEEECDNGIKRRLYYKVRLYNKDFYANIYLDNVGVNMMIKNFSNDDLIKLLTECKISKRKRNKIINDFSKFMKINRNKREKIIDLLFPSEKFISEVF